ncbi:hypothetical protein B0H34DRAFT_681808 [Crassisporium funariophilum]|nr:hypothetical protein B0H34DRAFT_681808 [Crassisporium funariophilum]
MSLTSSAIMTSRYTLMHASLAHLSQELQTMDFIIQSASTRSIYFKTAAALPTEILLIIRDCLFPLITSHLVAQSAAGLAAYEQSLYDLLCADCVAYNLDIYGPDVWQWEQFSGPCACTEIEGYRHARTTCVQLRHGHQKFAVNPKQFSDSLQWLEHHLSLEARSRSESKQLGSRTVSQEPRSVDIWDVVGDVLQQFNCEAVREADDNNRTLAEKGLSKDKRALVQIVPAQRVLNIATGDNHWEARVSLNRACRDLGLLLEYPEAIDACGSNNSPFTRRSRWACASNTYCKSEFFAHPSNVLDIVQDFVTFMASIAAACLSIPVTFATMLMTILCFYSKPRSLRIC